MDQDHVTHTVATVIVTPHQKELLSEVMLLGKLNSCMQDLLKH